MEQTWVLMGRDKLWRNVSIYDAETTAVEEMFCQKEVWFDKQELLSRETAQWFSFTNMA